MSGCETGRGGPGTGAADPPEPGPLEAGYLATVAARLATVRERIAGVGGDPDRIRVVAVTKGFGLEAVRAALALGLVDVGENYAGELVEKAGALDALVPGHGVAWHFLGGIQRNKVARIAPYVALYEAVDRLEEGRAIAAHAPGARVLVEVDTTGRPGRAGVGPGEVAPLVAGLVGLGLDVRGLMTVAPMADPVGAGRAFSTVAGLLAELGLAEASMGMTDDLEAAVAAGSTMVRVGRALFGPRPGRAGVPQ
ncbi:MAG TPA: YggS family pyridoxal phosphate enzyme [Acidimicrobiales bacterium]|nr:YggS family pyridoxal phosphate enzyme [Acidimicrobiales bacterium]